MKKLSALLVILFAVFASGCALFQPKPPTVDITYNLETKEVEYHRSGEQELQGLNVHAAEGIVDINLESQQVQDAVSLEAMKALNKALDRKEEIIERTIR